MESVQVKIESEKEMTTFLVIIESLPPGFTRSRSTLKYLLKKYSEGGVFDHDLDMPTKKFFGEIACKTENEIKRTGWMPTGKPCRNAFIYKEDFLKYGLEDFEERSIRIN